MLARSDNKQGNGQTPVKLVKYPEIYKSIENNNQSVLLQMRG